MTSASDSSDVETAAEPLRMELADRLADEGLLEDPAWRDAVETVPRHRFTPGFYQQAQRRSEEGLAVWEPVTAALDVDRWLRAVYADTTLITQFDGEEPDWEHPAPRLGGAPTSSSTLPSLVLRMWIDAGIDDGQDVLEIGTGSGYSTALACERLTSGNITSIDVDPHRLDQAAAALCGCGYGPDLAVADGLYGYRPCAPYDRIVAACSVRAIPGMWLAQTRSGGRILTTLSGWLYGYARVLLTVHDSGTADGVLLPGTISFMAARAHERPRPGNPAHWAALTRHAPARSARHSPARLYEPTAEGFFGRFLAQLAAGDAQQASVGDTTHLIDVTTGSTATLTPHDGRWRVRQTGPLPLWDRVEHAWDAWDAAGRPGPESFRIRIGHGRQTVHHPGVPELSFDLPPAPMEMTNRRNP